MVVRTHDSKALCSSKWVCGCLTPIQLYVVYNPKIRFWKESSLNKVILDVLSQGRIA